MYFLCVLPVELLCCQAQKPSLTQFLLDISPPHRLLSLDSSNYPFSFVVHLWNAFSFVGPIQDANNS